MPGLFRILFFLFVLLGLRLLLTKLFGGAKKRVQQKRPQPREVKKTISGRMVKDPQCGTYVASELAISAQSGGQTLHFCSEDCRKAFMSSPSHKASASR
jgi:YHS domain-containing protein